MTDSRPSLIVLALLAAFITACSSPPAPSTKEAGATAGARLTGPVSGGDHGFPYVSTALDLAGHGFVEEEYFVEGMARAYSSTQPLASEGVWSAQPAGAADYRTRILVRRPLDADRFNGTVLVEWLNVSGGFDTGPDWAFLHTLILDEGYAWVGVSAQQVGVNGFPPDNPRSALGNSDALKIWDPERYASLVHPGDSYSYDLYTQVGQALREPRGARPLGELVIRELIALGESQSASRLATYVNAVHPLAHVYDAFLVHSRGGSSAPLSQSPEPSIKAPPVVWLRDDVDVPVLSFATETDLTGLRFYAARQAETETHRLWEVAGTAHADQYQLMVAARDSRRAVVGSSSLTTCDLPLNTGPHHAVLKAAVHHLRNWTRNQTPPPPSPRIRVVPGDPNRILRDGLGNALGGIRTAAVDVPVATLSGEPNSGAVFCRLFGVTRPFEPDALAALYESSAAYRSAHDQAVDDSVRLGFVLPADAEDMKRAAAEVEIPSAATGAN